MALRVHEWRDLLVNAVTHQDETMLVSLVEHLAACERADAMLQANGHGAAGQPIDVMVHQALHPKDSK